MAYEKITTIAVDTETENAIKQNSPDKLPLNPTAQGWSSQAIRTFLAKSIVGANGSLLALVKTKFEIIRQLFEEVVNNTGDLANLTTEAKTSFVNSINSLVSHLTITDGNINANKLAIELANTAIAQLQDTVSTIDSSVNSLAYVSRTIEYTKDDGTAYELPITGFATRPTYDPINAVLTVPIEGEAPEIIDLKLEYLPISGEYNEAREVIILHLDNGGSFEIPVSAILTGANNRITSLETRATNIEAKNTEQDITLSSQNTRIKDVENKENANVNTLQSHEGRIGGLELESLRKDGSVEMDSGYIPNPAHPKAIGTVEFIQQQIQGITGVDVSGFVTQPQLAEALDTPSFMPETFDKAVNTPANAVRLAPQELTSFEGNTIMPLTPAEADKMTWIVSQALKNYITYNGQYPIANEYVGKKIFNGSEAWTVLETLDTVIRLWIPFDKNSGVNDLDTNTAISNLFVQKYYTTGVQQEGFYITDKKYFHVAVLKTRLTDLGLTADVNGWKTYLTTHNLDVKYKLAVVNPKTKQLVAGDILEIWNYTNIDAILIAKPVDFIGYNNLNIGSFETLDGYVTDGGAFTDNVSKVGTISNALSATKLAVVIDKTKYTDYATKGYASRLAYAQADLTGKTLTYQLATPRLAEVTGIESVKNPKITIGNTYTQLMGDFRTVGSAKDKAVFKNGAWWKQGYVSDDILLKDLIWIRLAVVDTANYYTFRVAGFVSSNVLKNYATDNINGILNTFRPIAQANNDSRHWYINTTGDLNLWVEKTAIQGATDDERLTYFKNTYLPLINAIFIGEKAVMTETPITVDTNSADDDFVFDKDSTINLESGTTALPKLTFNCSLDTPAQVTLISKDLQEKAKQIHEVNDKQASQEITVAGQGTQITALEDVTKNIATDEADILALKNNIGQVIVTDLANEVDSHNTDVTIHHEIDDISIRPDKLWSSDKINSELDLKADASLADTISGINTDITNLESKNTNSKVILLSDYPRLAGETNDTLAVQRAFDALGVGSILRFNRNTTVGAIVINGKHDIEVDGNNYTMNLIGDKAGIELRGIVYNLDLHNFNAVGDNSATYDQEFIWSASASGLSLYQINIHDNRISNIRIGISINADLSGSIKNVNVYRNYFKHIVGVNPGQGYGIHMASWDNDTFLNICIYENTIDDAQRHAIYCARGRGFKILRNHIINHRTTVPTAENSNPRGAMDVCRVRDVLIDGNTFINNYSPQILLTSGETNYNGRAYPLERVTIINNVMLDCRLQASITIGYVSTDNAGIKDINVQNNIIRNNVSSNTVNNNPHCIILYQVLNCNIKNNIMYQTTPFASDNYDIMIEPLTATSVDEVSIEGNTMDGTAYGSGYSISAIRFANVTGTSIHIFIKNNAILNAMRSSAFNIQSAINNQNIVVVDQIATGFTLDESIKATTPSYALYNGLTWFCEKLLKNITYCNGQWYDESGRVSYGNSVIRPSTNIPQYMKYYNTETGTVQTWTGSAWS